MGKKESLNTNKPVKTKGIDTVSGNELQDQLSQDFTPALEFKEPTSGQEAFVTDVAGRAGSSKTSNIQGSTGLINTEALEAVYAPVDLSQGLPDYHEREKFKAYHGEKMVKLFDENTFGLRFERDLEDLATYKEKQYPLAVKRFMDELDENQAWYTEGALTAGKLIGKTGLAVASIIPTVYGAGSALINWDSSKMFDNDLFDAWEYMDQGMDKHLAIYGGSDVWNFHEESGQFYQKDFVGRFINDPLKSLNTDIVPAVSFIAGAVATELVAGAITAGTGGTGAGLLATNTARLTAQLGNWGGRLGKYTKINRLIRGLDKLDDIKSAAKIEELTKTYRSGYGTLASGYRSSAYESALIARDTQDSTLQRLIADHEARRGTKPSASEMAEYELAAADAGESAYFMNVPLVAGSNFIQMPRLFMKNYRLARIGGGMMNKTKLSGTQFKKGVHVANADNKFLRRLGYAKSVLKGPLSEGFEEFAQGAMQEGLVDYYANNYSADSSRNIIGMLDTISKKAHAYANSTEGKDSMTIGALMGLLGLRAPIKIDSKTGKMGFSLTGTAFGGSRQEYLNAKEKVKKASEHAAFLNSDAANISPMLKMNMDNNIRHQAIQSDLDEAAVKGDVNEYKNKEYDSLFSAIHNRVSQGMGDSIIQEIDALDKMPLNTFNQTYGAKEVEEFTEESKAEALKKARIVATETIKSIEDVNQLLNKQGPDLFQKAIRAIENKVRKNKKGQSINPQFLSNAMKEQLAYLHSTVNNTKKREASLMNELNNLTNNAFGLDALNKVVAQISNVDTTGKAEFINKANETKAAALAEWKENDPVSYNMNINEAKPLIDDIMKLKIRRGEASKLYQGMLTPKGAKMFAGFAQELHDASMAEIKSALEEKVKANADKSRNASIEAQAKNETSVFGDSSITDGKIHTDVVNGLNEYNAIDFDMIPDQEIDNTIIGTIDKHPGLLALIKTRLKDQGFDLTGIKTTKEIFNEDTDNAMSSALYKLLVDLSKELELRNQASSNNPEFDNSEDSNQPAMEGSTDAETFERIKGEITNEDTMVGDNHTFINTHDKVIQNGKNVIDPITGKPESHRAQSDPFYKVDINKINSPDFLNNEELNRAHHDFEFRVQSNNPYNDTASIEDMVIQAVHVDPVTGTETVVSNLPAYKEGMPKQLLALRQEVVRRFNLTDEEIKAAKKAHDTKMSALRTEKKAIKDQLSGEVNINKRIKELEAEKETLTEEQSPEEITLNGLKENLKYEQELEEGNPETIANIEAQIEELEGTIEKNDHAGRIIEIEDELETLEESKGSSIQELKERLSEVNSELSELIGDLDVKVDNDSPNIFGAITEFAGISSRAKNRKALAKSKLEEDFGQENIDRANAINENFDDIVEQIVASGINVFFNEETNSHKEC